MFKKTIIKINILSYRSRLHKLNAGTQPGEYLYNVSAFAFKDNIDLDSEVYFHFQYF